MIYERIAIIVLSILCFIFYKFWKREREGAKFYHKQWSKFEDAYFTLLSRYYRDMPADEYEKLLEAKKIVDENTFLRHDR